MLTAGRHRSITRVCEGAPAPCLRADGLRERRACQELSYTAVAMGFRLSRALLAAARERIRRPVRPCLSRLENDSVIDSAAHRDPVRTSWL